MKALLAAALSIAAVLVSADPAAARTDSSSATTRYAVAFADPRALPDNAERIVAAAGGTVVSKLGAVGGVIATSSSPTFASTLAARKDVAAVDEDPVRSFVVPDLAGGTAPASAPSVAGADPLFGQQWDKQRIHATPDGSYAVQTGRRSVVVAVLDTGADLSHPDVAPNLDVTRSRSFVPTEDDLQDRNGHGTWALSAVGAPIDGRGISGVAPTVTLVALKVFDGAGDGSYGGVAEALVYAGDSRFDVASMSFGGSFDERSQRADVRLLERALKYARSRDVLPVAAAGNENLDLADDRATKGIVVLPAEAPGVVGVAATGVEDAKAYYSNYGLGVVDVAAPGGDRRFQLPPSPLGGGGRVLGAWSASAIDAVPADLRERDCSRGSCAWYVWMQGTSMAAPNAAGVAALIASNASARLSPDELEQALEQTASPLDCPSEPFNPGPPFDFAAVCTARKGENGFFGSGLVDALRAVSS